eukprot:4271862-Amphidinium_carterae.1
MVTRMARVIPPASYRPCCHSMLPLLHLILSLSILLLSRQGFRLQCCSAASYGLCLGTWIQTIQIPSTRGRQKMLLQSLTLRLLSDCRLKSIAR